MSRRPALGKLWFLENYREVYPRDEVIINGRPQKPPRAYDKWLEQIDPELMADVRIKRYHEAKDRSEYSLLAAETIHKARLSLAQPRDVQK